MRSPSSPTLRGKRDHPAPSSRPLDGATEFEAFIAARRGAELAAIEPASEGGGAREFAHESCAKGYVSD